MPRSIVLVSLTAALVLIGTASPMVAAADPAVTLRLAIVDAEDNTQGPLARAFIQEVSTRSGGTITIDPIWSAGGGAESGYEQSVTRQLVQGQADLALVPSRGWDAAGVTSLEAIEAPLLISDEATANAIATSPIADELLAGMQEGGAVGLAMWPEDMVHPAQGGCVEPITRPEQFRGKVIRAVPSAVTLDIIKTLGASQVFYDSYGADVGNCKINGLFVSLRRAPQSFNGGDITGDITLSPRMDVLAANATSFAGLSPDQQAALRDAAIAVRDTAIGEWPSEIDSANRWCQVGGTVIAAGPEGSAAFVRALQPVTDHLMADPAAAKAITEIRDLKAAITPAASASPCQPAPTATGHPLPSYSPELYSGTIPPNGTYRANVTEEDLLSKGASPHFALVQAKVYTLGFNGNIATWQEGGDDPCLNDVTSDGTKFSIREQVRDTCLGGDYVWREVPGGIELVPLVGADWPDQNKLDAYSLFYRTWTRID
jgi:TRAP-type C4-dicarboxylate transport system substrate-binding protein